MKEKNGNSSIQMYAYIRFMMLMALFLVAVDIAVYFLYFYAGLLLSFGIIAYILIVLIYYAYRKKKALHSLIQFASSYACVQTKMVNSFEFPYLLIDKDSRVIWANEEFFNIVQLEKNIRKMFLNEIFADFSTDYLPKHGFETEFSTSYNNKYYRFVIRFITDDNSLSSFNLPDIKPDDLTRLYAVSIFDETNLKFYMKKSEDETLVPALLYLDNYEETLEELDDVNRSIIMAMIDRKLTQIFSEMDAIIRKFERDKYIVLMRNSTLEELKEKKFPFLQVIREFKFEEDLNVTVSMGIGLNQGTYIKNLESAKISIDLALGRGGDQIVIKDGDGIRYFGGKSMAVEKNTKVKARVKAHALYELISVADNVVIMGHRSPDADCFGAACGLYRAAKSVNKKTSIVLDSEPKPLKILIDRYKALSDFDPSMFVNCDTAKEIVTSGTVLIIVDTCRADYTSCPELIDKTKKIIILDHHRQSSSVISGTALSYIEPYASSTCEMIAEILQYFDDNIRIKSVDADAMYAGIIVDTDNFLQKTGVRTFEAAAFLRRNGADSIRVRKMFREDFGDYMAKSEIAGNVSIYKNMFAISHIDAKLVDDSVVLGAKVANDFLNIRGIKASFVLSIHGDEVHISARAIDEINVQVIMERLGGGGHINVAACQLKDVTIDEAEAKLKEILDEMIDEGEI